VKAPEDLQSQMVGKTNDQLLEMFKQAEDWIPEALAAARAELQKRGIPTDTKKENETVAAAVDQEDQAITEKPDEEQATIGGITFRQQAAIGIPLGGILQMLSNVFDDKTHDFGNLFLVLFLAVTGLASSLWGCIGYAQGKGYSKWMGAWGLVPCCIGILFLIFLPDRRKGFDDHES
jgi:hypothetical protein